MTEQDIPQWWAQLLGEDHPAVKEWERYLRDITDPDDDYEYPPDSPDEIMAVIVQMYIRLMPRLAQAFIAQDIFNHLTGLRGDPIDQLSNYLSEIRDAE